MPFALGLTPRLEGSVCACAYDPWRSEAVRLLGSDCACSPAGLPSEAPCRRYLRTRSSLMSTERRVQGLRRWCRRTHLPVRFNNALSSPSWLACVPDRLLSLSEGVAVGMRTHCYMADTGHNGQEKFTGSLGSREAEVPGDLRVKSCSGGGWRHRGHSSGNSSTSALRGRCGPGLPVSMQRPWGQSAAPCTEERVVGVLERVGPVHCSEIVVAKWNHDLDQG